MDLTRVTTFQSQQRPLPQQQLDRVLAQGPPAIIPKNQSIPKTNVQNWKAKRYIYTTTASPPKKVPKNLDLWQNEPPDRRKPERRRSSPQAEKPHITGYGHERYVHYPHWTSHQTKNIHPKKLEKKLKFPRLQMNEKLCVRQYTIADPLNIY